MHFPTPAERFAAAMAATPASTFRRPITVPYRDWDEPQGDMEDMLAEHSTYRAVSGSVA